MQMCLVMICVRDFLVTLIDFLVEKWVESDLISHLGSDHHARTWPPFDEYADCAVDSQRSQSDRLVTYLKFKIYYLASLGL